MNTFYLTFGQQYPWCDGWVEVKAPDMATARQMVIDIFDIHWAGLYDEEQFKDSRHFYSDGKIGKTIK